MTDLSLTRGRAGSARGVAYSTGNLVQTAQACAGGGLRQGSVAIDIQTTQPISG